MKGDFFFENMRVDTFLDFGWTFLVIGHCLEAFDFGPRADRAILMRQVPCAEASRAPSQRLGWLCHGLFS